MVTLTAMTMQSPQPCSVQGPEQGGRWREAWETWPTKPSPAVNREVEGPACGPAGEAELKTSCGACTLMGDPHHPIHDGLFIFKIFTESFQIPENMVSSLYHKL